jgi:dienelactone hydrolase
VTRTLLNKALVAVLTVAAAVLGGPLVARYLRATALVVDVGRADRWETRVASWSRVAYRRDDFQIPSRHGALRARLYAPEGGSTGALLLVPGVHAAGIDEPRLISFAESLAARRLAVVTVELPDLVHYRITARAVDMIEDAALWLSRNGAVSEGDVGIAGVSFAGGLCVSAAGRPALRTRLRFVLSLGGHGDLRRTLHALCTGSAGDGRLRRPHDYGLAVALLSLSDRLVPPDQVAPLRQAVLAFLEASQLDGLDPASARAAFGRARTMELGLPEPAAGYMRLVNARDVEKLGALLLPHVDTVPLDPNLSPELAPPPSAPVYLLHGTADDVIPCDEARRLAAHLEPHARVRLLVTPVLRHAEMDQTPRWTDVARMIAFWAAALGE